MENKVLLERIQALETQQEKNSQEIQSRDQEIASLRQLLWGRHGEVVSSLEFQLNQQRQRAEEKERKFQCLKKETEDVKNKLAALSTKFQDLQNRKDLITSGTTDGPSTSRDTTVIQEHLKDALEKNQQWLVYDQEREAYVRSLINRIFHLEEQLKQASKELQQTQEDASTEVKRAVEEQQQQYEELLEEQEQMVQFRSLLSQLQEQNEHRQQEVLKMRQQLQADHLWAKKKLLEERRRSGECEEQLNEELKEFSARLTKERLRSAELQRQIQTSAKDLEDEKRDNRHLQRQLYRVLKELRKAKDRVAKLESEAENAEAEHTYHHKRERTARESQPSLTSPNRVHSLLDESFLECPNCRAQYPASHYQELLAHLDQCFD